MASQAPPVAPDRGQNPDSADVEPQTASAERATHTGLMEGLTFTWKKASWAQYRMSQAVMRSTPGKQRPETLNHKDQPLLTGAGTKPWDKV